MFLHVNGKTTPATAELDPCYGIINYTISSIAYECLPNA